MFWVMAIAFFCMSTKILAIAILDLSRCNFLRIERTSYSFTEKERKATVFQNGGYKRPTDFKSVEPNLFGS
ncbi:MAG TPA: hypothetical protein V6C71_17065 [Coleofasciculaceae cyanobacterium]|jgi:hypothetical protein